MSQRVKPMDAWVWFWFLREIEFDIRHRDVAASLPYLACPTGTSAGHCMGTGGIRGTRQTLKELELCPALRRMSEVEVSPMSQSQSPAMPPLPLLGTRAQGDTKVMVLVVSRDCNSPLELLWEYAPL